MLASPGKCIIALLQIIGNNPLIWRYHNYNHHYDPIIVIIIITSPTIPGSHALDREQELYGIILIHHGTDRHPSLVRSIWGGRL